MADTSKPIKKPKGAKVPRAPDPPDEGLYEWLESQGKPVTEKAPKFPKRDR